MRPITSLLLTALIFVNLFGFYVVFMAQQGQIRMEMSESVKKAHSANFQVINFSNTQFAQLNWSNAKKEFTLNSKLYDIVGLKKTSVGVEVTVQYDAGETELVNTFLSLFSQQQDKDQNSNPLKTFISHFQQDYVPTGQHFRCLDASLVSYAYIFEEVHPFTFFVADNLTPPPQFFLV